MGYTGGCYYQRDGIWGVLVLKLDRQICDNLRKIVETMGMRVIWPGWL